MGGGYVYYLKNNSLDAINSDLNKLQDNNWIDRQTRAVFIEYTLYNPNVDLFMYSLILFEHLTSGTLVNSALFSPILLYSNSKQVVITGCFIVYLILTLVLMYKEIKLFLKLKKSEYFSQFWVYIDWSLIILSWVSFPLYLNKLYFQFDLLKSFEGNDFRLDKDFLSFYYSNDLFQYLISICSFLATLRLLRLLRIGKEFVFLAMIVKDCLKSLISLSIILSFY